jgi:hypothetical protein
VAHHQIAGVVVFAIFDVVVLVFLVTVPFFFTVLFLDSSFYAAEKLLVGLVVN